MQERERERVKVDSEGLNGHNDLQVRHRHLDEAAREIYLKDALYLSDTSTGCEPA